ncbi:MAG: hypothetical protein AAB573_02960 [Patescibacteria group bacterium]
MKREGRRAELRAYRSADARIKKLLEGPLLVDGIESGVAYYRLHDDTDGENVGRVMVQIADDGDMHMTTDVGAFKTLRFRNEFGGGHSRRVHNALKILALAIKLDNKDKPQR